MSRAYAIWNKVTACIYQKDKSFGAKDQSNIEIMIGSSSNNSHLFVKIATVKKVTDNEVTFKFYADDMLLKEAIFRHENGRAGKLLYTRIHFSNHINP